MYMSTCYIIRWAVTSQTSAMLIVEVVAPVTLVVWKDIETEI